MTTRRLFLVAFTLWSVSSVAKPKAPPPPAPAPSAGKTVVKKDALHPVVAIKTSLGMIKIELDGEKAPVSTKNFLSYIESKHYDGTIFHRVINNFMIQGGGFDQKMVEKKTQAPIINEAANGLKNVKYSVAMARTMVPNSATSQFYINVVDNGNLDFRGPTADKIGYCVFGKVIEGTDVVDKIKVVQTGVDAKSGMPDVPTKPVVIESARRL